MSRFGRDVEILSEKPNLVVRLRRRETSEDKFPWINLLLFILTVITTVLTGALWEGVDWVSNPIEAFSNPLKIFLGGLPFSLSLLAILVFHEFGHYFAARYHGVKVTLPYFIPAPPAITLIGTFGAFIKSKSAFVNKKQLLDVGAAGPLAGLVIAIIVIAIGINGSTVQPMTDEMSGIFFGESMLFSFVADIVKGPITDNQVLVINSVGFAGWVGLLVTMFNLLPIGQLDGGHITYAMFGKTQKTIAILTMIGLAGLSFYWQGWIVWLFMGFLVKPKHPPTVMDEEPLDRRRKIIGYISIAAFIVCFVPAPIYFNV